MKINKQSNLYTIIYIVVLVVVVGCALAFTSLSLREKQQANVLADTMGQILKSVHVTPESNVAAQFHSLIIEELVINSKGEILNHDGASAINVAEQSKLPDSERKLPVYVCQLPDGSTKYIVSCYGAGLWGPIWGYVSFNSDGATIFGAYFNHQGETPGLGAEIEKPAFSNQFDGKSVIAADGTFHPVDVVKSGQKPLDSDCDYVDAVSGGTITSKGVAAMLTNCLAPYATFLHHLNEN